MNTFDRGEFFVRAYKNSLKFIITLFLITFYQFSYASTVTTYVPSGGFDNTDGANTPFIATEITKLATSDNSRIQTNASWPVASDFDESKYLEFGFNPAILDGSTITNVVFTHEYYEQTNLTNAKIEVWDGTNWVSRTISLPETSGTGNEITENIDITSILDNLSKVNNAKIRFLAYRETTVENIKTSHDNAVLTVTYNEPIPNDVPIADEQHVSTNVDADTMITLTGTDANEDPLTFLIVTNPALGTLGEIGPTGDVIYTPNGTAGNDSFTFKANDGKVDSEIATIFINVTSGTAASIELTLDKKSLNVSETANLTINLLDKFGNNAVSQGENIVIGANNDSNLSETSYIYANIPKTINVTKPTAGPAEITVSGPAMENQTVVINFNEVKQNDPNDENKTESPVLPQSGGGGGVVLISALGPIVPASAPNNPPNNAAPAIPPSNPTNPVNNTQNLPPVVNDVVNAIVPVPQNITNDDLNSVITAANPIINQVKSEIDNTGSVDAKNLTASVANSGVNSNWWLWLLLLILIFIILYISLKDNKKDQTK